MVFLLIPSLSLHSLSCSQPPKTVKKKRPPKLIQASINLYPDATPMAWCVCVLCLTTSHLPRCITITRVRQRFLVDSTTRDERCMPRWLEGPFGHGGTLYCTESSGMILGMASPSTNSWILSGPEDQWYLTSWFTFPSLKLNEFWSAMIRCCFLLMKIDFHLLCTCRYFSLPTFALEQSINKIYPNPLNLSFPKRLGPTGELHSDLLSAKSMVAELKELSPCHQQQLSWLHR